VQLASATVAAEAAEGMAVGTATASATSSPTLPTPPNLIRAGY